jgi:group I intron endonuclease
MIGIYKIINPKGRVYIGQSVNIENRWRSYKFNYGTKNQPRLYNSFKKYGVDNHIFEILLECTTDKLNNLERFYQDKYNAVGIKGLNCTLTKSNNKSGKLSKNTKIKISKSHAGKKLSYEHKKKLSEAKKGKKLSAEHINKIKITKSKKIDYNKGKSVNMICPYTNLVIKKYEKLSWAAKDGFNRFAISNVLSGKVRTSGGYIWTYA